MADHIVDNNARERERECDSDSVPAAETTHDAPRCDSDPVPVVDNQAAERA
jgi:hypothetical protein